MSTLPVQATKILRSHAQTVAAFSAVMSGNTRKLALMLANGLDPHLASNRKHGGVRLMQRAIDHGQREVVKMLEQAGEAFTQADLRAVLRKGEGWSEEQERLQELLRPMGILGLGLLHEAPDAATARRVVGWGVPVDEAAALRSGAGSALWRACRMGHLDLAAALLDLGADPNHGNSHSGERPLLEALKGHRATPFAWVKLLLDAGADPLASDSHGETVLSHAARVGCPRSVQMLLSAGADPRGTGTPRLLVSRSHRPDPVRPLESALWEFPPEGDARRCRLAVIDLLLAAGATWSDTPSRKKWSSLGDWMREEDPAWAALLAQEDLKNQLEDPGVRSIHARHRM